MGSNQASAGPQGAFLLSRRSGRGGQLLRARGVGEAVLVRARALGGTAAGPEPAPLPLTVCESPQPGRGFRAREPTRGAHGRPSGCLTPARPCDLSQALPSAPTSPYSVPTEVPESMATPSKIHGPGKRALLPGGRPVGKLWPFLIYRVSNSKQLQSCLHFSELVKSNPAPLDVCKGIASRSLSALPPAVV